MIKAVIFDFDGLIIDTESVWYNVYCEIFEEHGHKLPFEIWEKCVGTNDTELYHYLEKCLNRPIDRDFLEERGKIKHEALMETRTARPGVEAYLQAAQRNGLKIGLASSSSRRWVEGYLNRLGLIHYFECIRTSDDVAKIKPDPELYIAACQCLNVSPLEAIAFEDSPNGARAAKAAGLTCVIVPNEITNNMTFEKYDLKLNSMSEMALEEVVDVIAKK